MVSRETRVVLTSIAAGAIILVAGLASNLDAVRYGSVVLYLVGIVVCCLVLPQVYLAWTTDDSGLRKWHVRTGLLWGGILTASSAGLDPTGRTALYAIAALLLAALFVHEAVQGYRESALFEDAAGE